MGGFNNRTVLVVVMCFLVGFLGAFSYMAIFHDIASDKILATPLTEISSYTLLQRMNANDTSFVIVDTRDKDSYNLGHIKGAISMTPDEVQTRYTELPKNKDIILYCWSEECMLGPSMAATLVSLGVSNIKELRIGWCEWSERGYPIDGERYIVRSECLVPQRSINNENVTVIDSVGDGTCSVNQTGSC